MKWGVRKSQAKSYQKQLNSLDKESVRQIAKSMKADVKVKRYGKKAVSYIRKHDTNPTSKNVIKLGKIHSKMNQAIDKRDTYRKTSKGIDSKAYKIMADAAVNGYTVTSNPIIRDGEKGRTYAQMILAGAVGHTVINSSRYPLYKGKYKTEYGDTGKTIEQYPWAIVGNKYKVRDNK